MFLLSRRSENVLGSSHWRLGEENDSSGAELVRVGLADSLSQLSLLDQVSQK
jgi:hypothetical protein